MDKNKLFLSVAFLLLSQIGGCAGANSSTEDVLKLSTHAEIETAKSISEVIRTMSVKIGECFDRRGGDSESCSCEVREECPFVAEYDAALKVYCEAFNQYPDWKGHNVSYSYSEGSSAVAHTLGTKHIYSHYGKECN